MPDLIEYLWIGWLVLGLVFIIIELLTLEFTFLMLAAGTLIGGLGTNLLGAPWWLQVTAAAVVSALLLFTIRPLLLRALRKSSTDMPMNVDAIAGLGARVVAPFVHGGGSVRLDNGETWTAQLARDVALPDVGDRVTVVKVLGATVEVAPETVADGSVPSQERTHDAP